MGNSQICAQLRIHFASILHRGFQAFREPLEVRFPADVDVPPGQSAMMSKLVLKLIR